MTDIPRIGKHPSYDDVLQGLRRVAHRQVIRSRCEPVFEVLVQLTFVRWVKMAPRQSVSSLTKGSALYRVLDVVAELTTTGVIALDWLENLEQKHDWLIVKDQPYGDRYDIRHPANE